MKNKIPEIILLDSYLFQDFCYFPNYVITVCIFLNNFLILFFLNLRVGSSLGYLHETLAYNLILRHLR